MGHPKAQVSPSGKAVMLTLPISELMKGTATLSDTVTFNGKMFELKIENGLPNLATHCLSSRFAVCLTETKPDPITILIPNAFQNPTINENS
ncbi:MAG: hypothetical protein IPM82_16660 [Saprospiraceae bacterium]|nr:hypothetical protein [Saprospiraceae bacterium]